MKKYALVSVSDKTGLAPFVSGLIDLGFTIISSGGTKAYLKKHGISSQSVEEVTKSKEMLDGRVKTLHPSIHAGLLARRDNKEHLQQLKDLNIDLIDLVVVNLYPFKETYAKVDATEADIIENIDIGGPTMLRSAAKNFASVTVVVDPLDYPDVLNQLADTSVCHLEIRKQLAAKVFRHTAHYDAIVADYFSQQTDAFEKETLTLSYELKQSLRYGENPHQTASFYQSVNPPVTSIARAVQLHGKALSFNNIQDSNAALLMALEFQNGPVAVAVKHMNPCGVGIGHTIFEAFKKAHDADPVSIFGGIVALNREVDAQTAKKLNDIFLEIVIAPSFSQTALEILTRKENIRLLSVPFTHSEEKQKKAVSVLGGLLIQDEDVGVLSPSDVLVVTKKCPSDEEMIQLLHAFKVVKHVKSNAIVLFKEDQTVGIGAGQMNRVGAAKIAIEQAKEKARGSVLASDAFFPMPDTVALAQSAGITAIIQPGGSKRDQDSIDLCDQYGISMVMTQMRHFKH